MGASTNVVIGKFDFWIPSTHIFAFEKKMIIYCWITL